MKLLKRFKKWTNNEGVLKVKHHTHFLSAKIPQIASRISLLKADILLTRALTTSNIGEVNEMQNNKGIRE